MDIPDLVRSMAPYVRCGSISISGRFAALVVGLFFTWMLTMMCIRKYDKVANDAFENAGWGHAHFSIVDAVGHEIFIQSR